MENDGIINDEADLLTKLYNNKTRLERLDDSIQRKTTLELEYALRDKILKYFGLSQKTKLSYNKTTSQKGPVLSQTTPRRQSSNQQSQEQYKNMSMLAELRQRTQMTNQKKFNQILKDSLGKNQTDIRRLVKQNVPENIKQQDINELSRIIKANASMILLFS